MQKFRNFIFTLKQTIKAENKAEMESRKELSELIKRKAEISVCSQFSAPFSEFIVYLFSVRP